VTKTTQELTPRQRLIYEHIYTFTRKHGYQPSIMELMPEFDIQSLNGVSNHLRALQNKGFIEMVIGQCRALRFLRKPDGTEFTGFADEE
jgi:SOS-response transcriptional repressor LexA